MTPFFNQNTNQPNDSEDEWNVELPLRPRAAQAVAAPSPMAPKSHPHAEAVVNPKALAWTVGVHIVLLLLFFLIKYTTPIVNTPLEELGMEVNLGTSEDGSGNDQPMSTGEPADVAAIATPAAAARETDNTPDALQTDEPDAPEVSPARPERVRTPVNTQPRPTPPVRQPRPATPTQATATNQAAPRPQRPKYVFNGSSGPGGNNAGADAPGTSEGNTTGNGDRGVPGGTPGATNYEGSPGRGTGGVNHTLGGRSIIVPSMEASFREGGKVVVRVTVNRNGDIVGKTVVSAASGELRNLALRKLEKVRFSKSADAPEEQFGTITFVFKTRG